MGNSSANHQSDEVRLEMSAFTTPPRRQGARVRNGIARARDASNPYSLGSSSPAAASSTRSLPALRRPRHVSTGSMPAEQDPFVTHDHRYTLVVGNQHVDARNVESAAAAVVDAQQLLEGTQAASSSSSSSSSPSEDPRRTQSQAILEQRQHTPTSDMQSSAPQSEQQAEQPGPRRRQREDHASPGSPIRTPPTTRQRRGTGTTPRKPLSPAQIDARITDVLRKPLTRAQLASCLSGQDVGSNYVFEVVPRSSSSSSSSSSVAVSVGGGGSGADEGGTSQRATTGERKEKEKGKEKEKRIVKIGATRGSERVRLRQIQSACRHVLVEHRQGDDGSDDCDLPEYEPIPLYFKAERLAHAELHNFVYCELDCSCEVRSHGEYFDVDPATARDVVRRWRRFCKLAPYGSDGSLKPFWAHRLRTWRRGRKRGQEQGQAKGQVRDNDDDNDNNDGGGDHRQNGEETRKRQHRQHQHWERFASPTKFEILWYDLTAALGELWRWRWQAIALLEAFALTVLAFPSFAALLWFGAVALLIFAETTGTVRLEAPVTIPVAIPAVWRAVEGLVGKTLLS